MRSLIPALLVCSGLVVAACGGDDGTGSADTPPAAPATDRFEVTLEDDSRLVVTLDVPAGDPAVAPFEAYRQLVNGPEVVWLVGEITPPAGTDSTGRFVTFVAAGKNPIDDDPMDDTDGIVSSRFSCSALTRWTTAPDAPELTEAINAEYTRLLVDVCGGQELQVLAPGGETTTYVMLVEAATMPEFERIYAGLAYPLSPVG